MEEEKIQNRKQLIDHVNLSIYIYLYYYKNTYNLC